MGIKSKYKSAYLKNWKKNNPDKVKEYAEREKQRKQELPDRKERLRDQWLQENYGISELEYSKMLLEQDGKCAICGASADDQQHGRLYVDHCHDTGAVRGLLCFACNIALGYFKHNKETLLKAASYVNKHSEIVYTILQTVDADKLLDSL